MAREGTSTVVANTKEQYTINTYQCFGWELQNAQSLQNGNVKLVFTREQQIPNYARLVSLEEQYYGIRPPKKTKDKLLHKLLAMPILVVGILIGLWGGFLILNTLLGYLVAIISNDSFGLEMFLYFYPFPVSISIFLVGILLIGIYVFIHILLKKQYNSYYKVYSKKREAILSAAKTLL